MSRYAIQVWDAPGQPRRTYDRDDEITDCLTEARSVARTFCGAGYVGGGAAVIDVELLRGHPGREVARFVRGNDGVDEVQLSLTGRRSSSTVRARIRS